MKKIALLFSLLVMAMFAMPGTAYADLSYGGGSTMFSEGDGDDDEEDPQPYVEPPFTVYINIDNADAVYFTINGQRISHTAGVNTVTVDPGDGYIMIYVNEGYVFTKFDDTDQGTSYLQYDNQKYPVTIRKTTSVGMEEEPILNDGHHFDVTTFDTNSLTQYELTVDVDHANLAVLAIGNGIDMESTANRKVDLVDGINTIKFTEQDKYLHLCGPDWLTPLQNVTCNGKKVSNDGQINKVYTVYLKGAQSAGSEIVVTTYQPEDLDPYSFTAAIDDLEQVKYLTKYPADKVIALHDGENTITFKDGDYFEFITYQKAISCKFNDTEIPFDETTRTYTFTPTDGGHLNMQFIESGPQVPTFTVYVDDASQVKSLINYENDEEFDLVNGDNTVTIENEGDRFRLRTVDNVVPFSIILDDNAVTRHKNGYYDFYPESGSKLSVLFNEPVVQKDPEITINVDDASNIVVFTGSYASASSTIHLDNGKNTFSLDSSINEICVQLATGVIAQIVDADGSEYDMDIEMSTYYIPVVDGLELTITTEKVQFNETFLLIIEDFDDEYYGEMATLAERDFDIYPGFFDEVYFNSEYDMAMLYASEPMPTAIYINGELLEPDEEMGIYWWFPEEGDIVRIYLSTVPVKHEVQFDVQAEVADKFIIARDLYQIVDVDNDDSEVTGTYYVIFPDEEVKLKVIVSPIENNLSRAESFDEYEVPFDEEEGCFLMMVDNDMKITIKDATLTAIDTVEAGADAPAEVYNLRGHRLDATTLTPGIYIINGRKYVVK